ncbi:MAG: hypothetical protein Q9167_006977 [Letrouitia subvulpina]
MTNLWDDNTEKRVLLAALKLYQSISIFNNQSLDYLAAVANSNGQQYDRKTIREQINIMMAGFNPGVPLPG